MSVPRIRNSKLGTDKVRRLVPSLLSWFTAKARDLPWRRTRDPYAIWVSEIMLQQTQVKTVIPYWERWMRELPTVELVARASLAKLHKLWEGLGYYRRVHHLQRAARAIVKYHAGRFPRAFSEVLALPGVGRYTAGAICSIAFNQPRPILDGNVIRVLTRILGITADPRTRRTNERLWEIAANLVTHASGCTQYATPCSHLNQSLMELGALVCTPRSPACDACPVNKMCVARSRGWQERIPNLGQRKTTTSHRCFAFVVEREGRFLVRRRPAGGVNAHFWEFPNVEVEPRQRSPRRVASQKAMLRPVGAKPFGVIKHAITNRRITLEAWRAKLKTPGASPAGNWLTPAQLRRRAFTAAHGRIRDALLAAE